jgi:hypothetical protein
MNIDTMDIILWAYLAQESKENPLSICKLYEGNGHIYSNPKDHNTIEIVVVIITSMKI